MTPSDIQAVIFDLGRVLVAIDNRRMVEKLFGHINSNDPELVEKTMKSPMMIDLCLGQIEMEEVHRRTCRDGHLDMSFDMFKNLWRSIFYTMDGAEELVMQLNDNVKLGLLSDTDAVHWEYIRKHWPWLEVIERPTLSFELGLMKPDPAIYLKAAENVGAAPEQCLFIDDLAVNVDGACAVGMTAIQFENTEQIRNVLKTYHLL